MNKDEFDVAVVGGGIIGAGVARDVARRGLRCILLEKRDFGWGTTAGSTRLVHGGLRYLEMLDFGLVRMDLRERETLLRIAPHLVKPLPFHLPYFDSSLFYRTKMQVGLWLYDMLSFDKSLPNRGYLSRPDILRQEPSLRADGLSGVSTFYDAQVNMPERLCLENVLDAAAHGAEIRNSVEVVGALREGARITGLRLMNEDGQEELVRAKIVCNTSGPWFDEVAGRLRPEAVPRVRTTKGVHLACEPLIQNAWVLFSPVDGRLFFAIPWMGLTWIGTTDTDYGQEPGIAAATPDDIEYLLRSTERYFPAIRERRLCFTNAGVRALVRQAGKESSVSRSHLLADGEREGTPGLVSVIGGKITGYRAIAEETVDLIAGKLNNSARCETAAVPLPGAAEHLHGVALESAGDAAGIPETSVHTLREFYGTRFAGLVRICIDHPEYARPLHDDYPEIYAQIRFAVRDEYCRHLDDFLVRRTSLGFSPDQGQRAAPAVAEAMAAELGWDDETKQRELQRWERYLARTDSTGSPVGLNNKLNQ